MVTMNGSQTVTAEFEVFSASNEVGNHVVSAQPGATATNVPIFTVSSPPGMQPGDQVTGAITITNSSTVPAAFTLAEANVSHQPPAGPVDLSGYLQLTIVDCGRVDGTNTANCSTGSPIYSGAFNAVGGSSHAYVALPPKPAGSFWAAGEAHEYQFTLSFVSHGDATDNQYQGTAASADFVWTATSQ
jgi:hypothetical protein